jgi:hypothetical protein
MANPIKGEVAFTSGRQNFTAVLGTYGLSALERRMGRPVHKLFAASDDVGVDTILACFHASLLRHHGLSELEVADMVDEMGFDEVTAIVGEVMALAFSKEEAKAPGNPQRPAAKTRAGTGKGS